MQTVAAKKPRPKRAVRPAAERTPGVVSPSRAAAERNPAGGERSAVLPFPVQARLRIGARGDPLEREADATAARVLSQPGADGGERSDEPVQPSATPPSSSPDEAVALHAQRQSESEESQAAIEDRQPGPPVSSASEEPVLPRVEDESVHVQDEETASPQEEEQVSPQEDETAAAQADEEPASMQGEEESASPQEEEEARPQEDETATAQSDEEPASMQGEEESVSPQEEEQASPQEDETATAQSDEEPASMQGEEESASPQEEEQASPQEDETVATQSDEERVSPQGEEESASPQEEEQAGRQEDEAVATQADEERVSSQGEEEGASPPEDEQASLQEDDTAPAQSDEERAGMQGEEEAASPQEDEQASPQGDETLAARADEERASPQSEGRSSRPTPASPDFEAGVDAARGLGKPLSPDAGEFMESRFGVDFSDVRIHTDARAAQLSKEIGALAFTVGRDVFFAAGRYDPGSRAGRELLAHELTHVLQQTGRRRAAPGRGTEPRVSSSPRQAQGGFIGEKLNKYARQIPGYTLITVLIGFNPLTDKKVPRTAINLVEGLLGLIPGGTLLFDKLNKSGALQDAFNWLSTEVDKLQITWSHIKALISQVWDEISIFRGISYNIRVVKRIFGPTVRRIINFVKAIGGKILEFVFQGALKLVGAPVAKVMSLINKGASVIGKIFKDPIGFVKNLAGAVKLGLNNFVKNIKKHLLSGLVGWLFGTLSKAGITLPEKFDLKGVFSLILQILGLTYDNIRIKLVKHLGEKTVSRMEKVFNFIKDLITKGPIVLWEKVKESLTNLKDAVLGGIRSWVITTVIKEGVTWIVGLLNPVGALIKILKVLWSIIQFFLERWKQIVTFANSVFDSIAEIAAGNLKKAAAAVENALGRAIPVIISFLANLLGLGGIAKTIKKIIAKIRAPIDKAIDKVVGWLVKKGKSLLRKGRRAVKKREETKVGPAQVKKLALRDVSKALRREKFENVGQVEAVVGRVYKKYRPKGLKAIDIKANPKDPQGRVRIVALASPGEAVVTSLHKLFGRSMSAKEKREKLGKATQTSWAALSVNGRLKGKLSASGKEKEGHYHGHSEEKIVKGPTWKSETELAAERAAGHHGGKSEGSVIAIAINRSPCHKICVPELGTALDKFHRYVRTQVPDKRRNRLKSLVDQVKDKVRFVLSALGLYKGKFGKTTESDVSKLIGKGWQARAILKPDKRDKLTDRGKEWKETILSALDKVKKGR